MYACIEGKGILELLIVHTSRELRCVLGTQAVLTAIHSDECEFVVPLYDNDFILKLIEVTH